MKKILLLAILISNISCSSKVVEIKSPCVSANGGPCGDKKPVNDWWLKNSNQHKVNT